MPSLYPFPNTDPWVTKSVLSIDGGGVRGYGSLVIVQALMEKIGEIERVRGVEARSSVCSPAFKVPDDDKPCVASESVAMPISGYWPCHYFDYIAGVGTGGIIALFLGRYRMSVGEAIERYREICTIVVERQLTSPSRRRDALSSTKHQTPRQSTVNLVPAWPSPNEYEGGLKSDPKRCRTIACGCGPQLQPFRSYPSLRHQRGYAINDIILRCVRPNPPPEAYPNANYFYNNPSRTVLTEVSSRCKHKSLGDGGIDLLSIGAGIHEPVKARVNELQFRMSKQSQLVHNELSGQPSKFHLNNYCRLDPVDPNLDHIGVNEFRSDRSTFRQIEEATKRYLQNEKTARQLHDFATALVDKRRLRAETLQWERWALGIIYRCPMFKCAGWNERFEDRVGLWAHLCRTHGMQYSADDNETKREEYEVYEMMGQTREAAGLEDLEAESRSRGE